MDNPVGSYFPKVSLSNPTELKVKRTNIRFHITETLTPKQATSFILSYWRGTNFLLIVRFAR